jgi:hypothetical protein
MFGIPSFAESHQQRILRNMAERIGREELATQLGVPASLLDEWMAGQEMPLRKLIVLAKVITKAWRSS